MPTHRLVSNPAKAAAAKTATNHELVQSQFSVPVLPRSDMGSPISGLAYPQNFEPSTQSGDHNHEENSVGCGCAHCNRCLSTSVRCGSCRTALSGGPDCGPVDV